MIYYFPVDRHSWIQKDNPVPVTDEAAGKGKAYSELGKKNYLETSYYERLCAMRYYFPVDRHPWIQKDNPVPITGKVAGKDKAHSELGKKNYPETLKDSPVPTVGPVTREGKLQNNSDHQEVQGVAVGFEPQGKRRLNRVLTESGAVGFGQEDDRELQEETPHVEGKQKAGEEENNTGEQQERPSLPDDQPVVGGLPETIGKNGQGEGRESQVQIIQNEEELGAGKKRCNAGEEQQSASSKGSPGSSAPKDPPGPTGHIVHMFTESYPRGELVHNAGFEYWRDGLPKFWQGENISVSTIPHTADLAARLGADPGKPARISQVVFASPGCYLQMRFNLQVIIPSDQKFIVQVEWLDANRFPSGSGLWMSIPVGEAGGYRHYASMTCCSPWETAFCKVVFRSFSGQIDLDDVSVIAR